MFWRMILSVTFFLCAAAQAGSSPSFPPPGVTLPEYWGEEHVWWHGRASFKGQVIAPACTLAMEDTWQAIDIGETPVRDLQNSFSGPEKRFRLRLRNCELAGTGKRVYTASRVRVTFDGLQGETPDKFSLTGRAEGINLQILDNQGYPARVGKVMPPLLLNGNEDGLDYTLRVVRNGQPLKAGDYYAALRFKVDYE
ncbi:type 1 fimbrial protein [Salmonella enterica]|uniref:Type 1 fimbrial protein n=1 Tax=Escherichia marmotae TaxID=1499973 RepID=A0ABU1C819_9ESCH|nr:MULTISPECIES: fimbrial protein [Escherichia]EDX8870379.1 type 1 fimbrial protein [Salmonella enterica subsp. enterica serovar Anatum]EGU3225162.1 type 1 fimbrial protein [Salmonella enterica]EGX8509122.1 type 1 fimbrial protein [Salmonella enterica subsp. enterica serovar Typhimurium]EFB2393957.1 type 1 fimbrial protein [Escherichia coli]EGU4852945.1 type 1 fimbrial protein [Salmonella enterica]